MKRLGDLALLMASILVLAFVFSEVFSLWQSLSYRPAPKEEIAHEAISYARMKPEQIGEIVFQTQGCRACHNLDLQGGVLAPSLDNVAVRRPDPTWLRGKILDPHVSIAGTYMPAFHNLSEEELDGLVAFLRTLTPQRKSPDNTGMATIEIPKNEQGQPRFSMVQIERGKELFQVHGCIGCHTINGFFEGGSIGPNLTHESQRKRSDEWQLQHLIDPLSVYVVGDTQDISWIMPAYRHLTEEELQALVAFLQSLK